MEMASIDEQFEKLKREYNILAENALECIWIYDIKADRFTYTSPSVLKLRGYTVEESLRQSIKNLMTEDSLKKLDHITKLLITRFVNGERQEDMLSQTGDFELKCRDGTIKQVEIKVRLTYNAEIDSYEIIGVSRNVTERKQLEKQLNQAIESKNELIRRFKESERELRQLTKELNQKNIILNNLAVKDALTGIFNRYGFNQKIIEESDRCRIYDYSLSIALFDIDNFKRVNDTYGHEIGDNVLRGITGTVNELIRKQDVFARWGGEEFVVLMPHMSLYEATETAEKLRKRIEEIQHNGIDGGVTVSFGVTEFMHGETEQSWFRRVDYAMFCSKNNGKNRVTSISWGDAVPMVQVSLSWRSEWECGNSTIDDQHRKLIYLGNELLEAAFIESDSEDTAKALNELLKHIEYHFSDEEGLLWKLGYPDVKEHAEIHDSLIKRVNDLRKQYEGRNLKSTAIFSFLLDEIVTGHMLKEDVRFFPYIKKAEIDSIRGI